MTDFEAAPAAASEPPSGGGRALGVRRPCKQCGFDIADYRSSSGHVSQFTADPMERGKWHPQPDGGIVRTDQGVGLMPHLRTCISEYAVEWRRAATEEAADKHALGGPS